MREWSQFSLREISTHIKDGTHGTHQRVEYGIPFLSAKNIGGNGRLSWDKGDDLVSESDYSAITAAFTPKHGDVLLTVVGSIGRAAIFDGSRVAFQRSVAFVRCNNDVLPEFLYQAIASADFTRQLERRCNVTAQAGLYLGELAKCRVSLPSRALQQKIASILTATDTAIEKTEALIAKYQQIKAGLMHDLFTRGVLPNGQLRPIGASVQTSFGKIPSEWRLGSILELTDPQRQPILTGPFGADLGSADFVAEGIPVLRIGNVQQGRLDLDDLLHVSTRKAATLSRYRIREGDLLFARQGATTGRNALADECVEGYLINYHIIRLALDHERCAPLFVEAAFANEIIKRQVERDKGRGTREGINTAQLTSLAFPIAPLPEQRLIAEILLNHNSYLRAAASELQSLHKKKIGLMQDLLTGKVPVQVDEPEVVDG